MSSDSLAALSAFVRVVETGGFTAAAQSLGLTTSAVSHSVRQLEKQSGTRLLNRTTRSVGLTEAGDRFYKRVAPIVSEMQSALGELTTNGASPAGTLRVTMSRSAFSMFFEPIMHDFLVAFPAINIDVSISSTLANIVGGGFDAGIRHSEYLEQDMIAVPLDPEVRTALVASPGYLAGNRPVESPDDLREHQCIRYRSGVTGRYHSWTLSDSVQTRTIEVKGRVAADDAEVMLNAAIAGAGIASLWDRYADQSIKEGKLVRVLPEWSPVADFALFYFDRGHVPQKLRALIDFIKKRGSES
jgi:DNA-binding transcriptional LysR family regulator